MITFRVQKNLIAAKEYFGEHLGRGDYRREDQAVAGSWLGLGLDRVGLVEGNTVEQEEFHALCENRHPGSGAQLTARMNRTGERRIYTDIVVSAPKPVSIMAITLGDAKLVEAHRLASRVAMRELERLAAARVRGGLKNRDDDRPSGNVILAEFGHDSSRALDPLIHNHYLAFNCTFDLIEARWKALQAGEMMRAVTFATAVYRHELARRLQELGYILQDAGREGFLLEGVSEEICRRFSERTQERDQAVERFRRKHGGRSPDKDEVSVLVHRTRAAKLRDVTAAEVLMRQRAKLSPDELGVLQGVRRAADARRFGTFPKNVGLAVEGPSRVLTRAAERTFDLQLLVPERELLTEALILGRGHVDLQELRAGLSDPEHYARVEGGVTTLDVLRAEKRMIERVDFERARHRSLCAGFQPHIKLDNVQRAAVQAVLETTDGLVGLRGSPGPIRNIVLGEVIRGIEEGGGRVHLCSSTSAATETFRAAGVKDVSTLENLLNNPQLRDTFTINTVLILDGGDLVGVRQTDRLFALAQERGCRVLLAGDVRRRGRGATAGNVMDMLERDGRLRAVELTSKERRRHASECRQAIADLTAGRLHEGYDRLDGAGAIQEVGDTAERYGRATDVFLASLDGSVQRRSCLIFTTTWDEVARVTAEVRARLRVAGRLTGEDRVFSTINSLGWTRLQRRDPQRYEPGQILVFHRVARCFACGEILEIISPAAKPSDPLLAKRAEGEVVEINGKQAGAFDVCERRDLSVAIGERLLLRGTRRERGNTLTQGQFVSVSGFGPEGNSIQLSDGRTVPADYQTWCHGYVLTPDAAQRQRVIDSVVCAGNPSLEAWSAEEFCLAASRARQTLTIFTDDREALRAAATRTRAQRSAAALVAFAVAHRPVVSPSAPPTALPSRPKLPPLGPSVEVKVTDPTSVVPQDSLRPSPRDWWRHANQGGRQMGAQVSTITRNWRVITHVLAVLSQSPIASPVSADQNPSASKRRGAAAGTEMDGVPTRKRKKRQTRPPTSTDDSDSSDGHPPRSGSGHLHSIRR